jgi:phage terminase large subunit-like protein
VTAVELTHDGNPTLAAHVLNARRKDTNYGITITKEFPSSPTKIDAAIAAVLAWQARLDALARPAGEEPRQRSGQVW